MKKQKSLAKLKADCQLVFNRYIKIIIIIETRLKMSKSKMGHINYYHGKKDKITSSS